MPKKTKTKGFTLIEMMVSVSIFVIVAFIVVSTLLTMSAAYKKAQAMRLLMDNFNFSIQSMSLSIREGIDYGFSTCDSSQPANSCIQFLPVDSWIQGNTGDANKVCYEQKVATIKKCLGVCPCSDGEPIISSNITIKNLKFNSLHGGSKKLVKIIIDGEAGKTLKDKTSFFIQNSISQRNPD